MLSLILTVDPLRLESSAHFVANLAQCLNPENTFRYSAEEASPFNRHRQRGGPCSLIKFLWVVKRPF